MRRASCFSLLLNLTLAIVALAVAPLRSAWAEEPGNDRADTQLTLTLRSRVEAFKGSGDWREVQLDAELPPTQTALLLCDVWDRHWCQAATRRCDLLARQMAPLVEAARAAGLQIVHAPSGTMDFYRDSPARLRAVRAARIEPPADLPLADPKLPIDDSDGGCDDVPESKYHQAWTRQHPAIKVADADIVSDDGREIYSYLHARGVKHVIVMGVHTNMCVLGRSFGIRQLTRWGLRTLLIRDLTDTMYDPKDPPHVSHEAGTELVVQHIEKYWCPSVESKDVLAVLTAR